MPLDLVRKVVNILHLLIRFGEELLPDFMDRVKEASLHLEINDIGRMMLRLHLHLVHELFKLAGEVLVQLPIVDVLDVVQVELPHGVVGVRQLDDVVVVDAELLDHDPVVLDECLQRVFGDTSHGGSEALP